jgi:GAF domain-containing protein
MTLQALERQADGGFLPSPDLSECLGHPIVGFEGAGQTRLHALLPGNLAISSDLSLPDVLRRIVAAACRLSGARSGAVTVLDGRGRIGGLVHVGMDEPTATRMGSWPAGNGLLGLLFDERARCGCGECLTIPGSVGFPEGHPPIGAFLGVPIRVRDSVVGTLYLTDPVGGEFNQEDEEIVIALAANAGIAMENARLYEQEQRGGEWLAATLEVTSGLLHGTGVEPLATVARAIGRVSKSDFVLVLLPGTDGTLMVEVAVGDGTEHLPGYSFPRAGSISGAVLGGAEAVRVGDARTLPTSVALRALSEEIDVGPVLFLPLVGQNGGRGVLVVGRRAGRELFERHDVDPAVAFANHASLALELADGRLCHQRMVLLEERDRVAGELHDQVLQRLFATEMSMQAMAGVVGPPCAERIERLIHATDETIARIRSAIQDRNGFEPDARTL